MPTPMTSTAAHEKAKRAAARALPALRRVAEQSAQGLEAIAEGEIPTAHRAAADALRHAIEAFNVLHPAVSVVVVERSALERYSSAYNNLASLSEIVSCDGDRTDCPGPNERGSHAHTESVHRRASEADVAAIEAALGG